MSTQEEWILDTLNYLKFRGENLHQRIICLGKMLNWNQSIIPQEDCDFWGTQNCKIEKIVKMSGTYYTATLPKFKTEAKKAIS